MARFIVYLRTVASTSVEVEAADPGEAMDKAYDVAMPTLCAQCAGWGNDQNLELNDAWEVSAVADGSGDIVLDAEGGDR